MPFFTSVEPPIHLSAPARETIDKVDNIAQISRSKIQTLKEITKSKIEPQLNPVIICRWYQLTCIEHKILHPLLVRNEHHQDLFERIKHSEDVLKNIFQVNKPILSSPITSLPRQIRTAHQAINSILNNELKNCSFDLKSDYFEKIKDIIEQSKSHKHFSYIFDLDKTHSPTQRLTLSGA